jgi:hypothetical protein
MGIDWSRESQIGGDLHAANMWTQSRARKKERAKEKESSDEVSINEVVVDSSGSAN